MGLVYAVYIHIILKFFFEYQNLETYVYGGLPIIPTHLIDRLGKLYYIINENDIFCSLPSINYSLPKQDHIYGLLDVLYLTESTWFSKDKYTYKYPEIKLGYTTENFFTILSKKLPDYKLQHTQNAYKKKFKNILVNYFTENDEDLYFTQLIAKIDLGFLTDFFIYLKIISIFKFKIIFDIFEIYLKNRNYDRIYENENFTNLINIVKLMETYRVKFKPHSTPILDMEKYEKKTKEAEIEKELITKEAKIKNELKTEEAKIKKELAQKNIIEENAASLSGIFMNIATILSF